MGTTVAHLVIDMLERAGVRLIFGLPGTSTLDLLDAIYDAPQLRYVSVRHEQVAGSMAEGYARASGRVTVCIVHSGSGSASIMPAIASAYRDKAPIIVLSADEWPWTIQEAGWQAFDTLPIFAPITKWNVRAHNAEELPQIIDRALLEATSGRTGPVHISLPKELTREPLETTSPIWHDAQRRCPDGAALLPRQRPAADPEAVRRSAALLTASSRPLVIAGGGVLWSGAAAEVQALVERLGCPVLTTELARGGPPEDHPLALGILGSQGYPVSLKAFGEADCLLALGSELIDVTTGGRRSLDADVTLIRVDLCAEPAVTRLPVSLDIQADARTYLRALLKELSQRPSDAACRFARAMKEQWQAEHAAFFARAQAANGLNGAWIVNEVAAVVGRDALIGVDAGMHAQIFVRTPIYQPRCYYKSSGLGSMAIAFPGIMGAKLAFPERQAVALVGDSCFMMTLQDFETAVREAIPVVVVVYNNYSFGSQARMQMQRFGDRSIGTRHGNPDFAELARLFGGVGERVEKPADFRPALERVLAQDKPAVIDCIVEIE